MPVFLEHNITLEGKQLARLSIVNMLEACPQLYKDNAKDAPQNLLPYHCKPVQPPNLVGADKVLQSLLALLVK